MNRSMARELAMKLLYSRSVGGDDTFECVKEQSEITAGLSEEDMEFAHDIINGVTENTARIDELIDESSSNWKVSRMPKVDLCIMRIAAFELLYQPNIPYAATVNEAVELAKRYGDGGTPKFVNGVLGAIIKKLPQ